MQAQSKNAPPADASYRPQLIDGFCAAVEHKGFAATTIADIVKHARVSKRTFYEEFDDKEDCFVAAYADLSKRLMQAMVDAVDAAAPWHQQIDAAIRAYLSLLDERPALTRAFFLSIQVAGPRALRLRREVLESFATLTRNMVELGRPQRPELRSLSPLMAMAMVGGINELVLSKVEKGGATRLTELAQTAVELVTALLAPGAPARKSAR